MTADQLKASLLQMAIQGKLVPQRDDEPAVDIDAEEPEEVPFAIPEKWKWVTVQDAMERISTGPFGSMLHKTDYVVNGIPVINPANLATGSIIPSQTMMVSEKTVARLSAYCLHTGMVVMGRRGEMGRCAEVTEKEDGWLCGTGSFSMQPNEWIDAKFICLFFSTAYARNYLMGESVGTTMCNLNHKILKRLPVPIPPLAEQRRIVARLNELLPIVDEYGKSQKALHVLETDLPGKLWASLLQQAIMGKLVPQLDNEPAVDIDAEGLEEVPFAIPEKWKWVRLATCITLKSGRDLERNKILESEEGIPYLTGASQIDNGRIIINRWTKNPTVISKKGDLLLTCKGTVGKVAINNIGDMHIARQIMAICCNQIVLYFLFIETCTVGKKYDSRNFKK